MDVSGAVISLIGGGVLGQLLMRIVSIIWPTKTEEIDVDAKIQKSLENHVNFLQGQINDVRDENVKLRADHNECEVRCSTMAVEIRKLKMDMTEVRLNAAS